RGRACRGITAHQSGSQRNCEVSDVEGARQERFQSILRKHGVVVTLRREKGHDIAAACGQLRLQTNRAARTAQFLLLPSYFSKSVGNEPVSSPAFMLTRIEKQRDQS